MRRIDYEKLRQLDTVPLLEFEESLNEKMKREVEAKKREARDEAKKSKRKRNRDKDRD
jgi:hypothetical protein